MGDSQSDIDGEVLAEEVAHNGLANTEDAEILCSPSPEDGSEVDLDDVDFEVADLILANDQDNSDPWPTSISGGELSDSSSACAADGDQQDPYENRFYEVFHDYFRLNDLVRTMAHRYYPANNGNEDGSGELGRRRGSTSSTGSDQCFDPYTEMYGGDSPPYSPYLQDYFPEERIGTGGGRRDLSLAQRRGKVPSGRSFQSQQRVVCVFCRNNGEAESLYASHALKDSTGKVTCPILRAYTCPVCKAHGDNAHTLKYCPKNDSPAARQAQAAAAVRGRTSTSSNGIRRREKLPNMSFPYLS